MATRRWWPCIALVIALLAGCGSPSGTAVVVLSTVSPVIVPTAASGQSAATSTQTNTPTVVLVATATGTIAVPITATPLRFDTSGSWASAGTMSRMRLAHTATLLADGRVLVVGGATNLGAGSGTLNKAELYDPATNRWSDASDLTLARSNHTATMLADGRVVVLGGRVPLENGNGWQATADTSLFNSATNGWQSLAPAPTPRSQHTATLLTNGSILVVGGLSGDQQRGQSSATVELYDPATNTWTTVGSLAKARHGHTATLLADGRVLITGGESRGVNNATDLTASTEIYDPATRTWSASGPLSSGRQAHTATLLADGRVLVVGGETSLTRGGAFTRIAAFSAGAPAASAEIFDPRTLAWQAAANLPEQRAAHTATILPDGRVLVVGGVAANDQPTTTALRYDPADNRWTPLAAPTSRAEHTATLLPDGSIIVVGGRNTTGVTDTAERYFPQGQPSATPTPASTATPEPPTATPVGPVAPGATATPTPTRTRTPVPTVAPPTATPTRTPTSPPSPPGATATRTNMPIPPTATYTPTNTPVPPTATNTPIPPTATRAPIPPTATATSTRIPPTLTPTNTRVPPTSTSPPVRVGTIVGYVDYCPKGKCVPAPGALVSVSGYSTTANANAYYTFTGVPPGTYTVVASYQGAAASVTIRVVGGDTSEADIAIITP